MATSPLGEPRVPKPKSQGDVKLPTAKAPLRGGNSGRDPGRGKVKFGTRRNGIGGSGRTSNSVPRN